jgi:hypothetical protein
MLILHGIYQNGKAKIKDNHLPEGFAEAEIFLKENKPLNKEKLLSLSGSIKRNLNGLSIQKKLRKEWSK